MPKTIDLNESFGRASVKIDKEEHADERVSRLKREERTARFEIVRSYLALGFVSISVLVGTACCFYIVVQKSIGIPVSEEGFKFATYVLNTVVTGTVSYLIGQKVGAAK